MPNRIEETTAWGYTRNQLDSVTETGEVAEPAYDFRNSR